MAVENILMRESGTSAVDLSAKQYYALQRISGTDNLFSLATAATQKPGGILQNKPTAGQAIDTAILGQIKYIAGGTIHNGDKLTATTSGKLIATTTDKDCVWGVADGEASDGDTATMTGSVGGTLSAT
jgi:hypothetical protein